MPQPVVVEIEGVTLRGELLDTPPAQALARLLPLTVKLSRWGEEYYGDLGEPLGSFQGETQTVMSVGDLAYWEPGNAFCIFFGPTPASSGPEPVAASQVHPLGRVEGDWQALSALGGSVTAKISAA